MMYRVGDLDVGTDVELHSGWQKHESPRRERNNWQILTIATAPPLAPTINTGLRPKRSIRKMIQTNAIENFTTPKIPVERRPVLIPVMPIDRKTVGE
jgi:hypothetical protein